MGPGSTAQTTCERLGRIRDLLAQGLNLVGIAHVLTLEEEVVSLRQQLEHAVIADRDAGAATARLG